MWSGIQPQRFVELAGMHELADYCRLRAVPLSGAQEGRQGRGCRPGIARPLGISCRPASRRSTTGITVPSPPLGRAGGGPERWDWRAFPSFEEAAHLARDFRKWVVDANIYAARESPCGAEIDFYSAVHAANMAGNDSVAGAYRRVWENHIQHDALARFVRHLRPGSDGDIGCLTRLAALRLTLRRCTISVMRVVGNDISRGMLKKPVRSSCTSWPTAVGQLWSWPIPRFSRSVRAASVGSGIVQGWFMCRVRLSLIPCMAFTGFCGMTVSLHVLPDRPGCRGEA